MAGLIKRTGAAQVKAGQFSSGPFHQFRVEVEVFAEHGYRLSGIGSLNANAERIAVARWPDDPAPVRWFRLKVILDLESFSCDVLGILLGHWGIRGICSL